MCAAKVKFYRTYSLYYLVLCVSYDFCAVYLYFFTSTTQILRVIVAPTQLVPATTPHSPPHLKSQWWSSCSGSNGGSPVPEGANVGPSHPCPPTPHPFHPSHFPIQPVNIQSIVCDWVQVILPHVVSAGANIFTKQTRCFRRFSAPTSTLSPLELSHLLP